MLNVSKTVKETSTALCKELHKKCIVGDINKTSCKKSGIYFIYNAEEPSKIPDHRGRIVYVGQASSISQRRGGYRSGTAYSNYLRRTLRTAYFQNTKLLTDADLQHYWSNLHSKLLSLESSGSDSVFLIMRNIFHNFKSALEDPTEKYITEKYLSKCHFYYLNSEDIFSLSEDKLSLSIIEKIFISIISNCEECQVSEWHRNARSSKLWNNPKDKLDDATLNNYFEDYEFLDLIKHLHSY